MNFLGYLLIELFSLGVTAEALRAKTDRKLAGGSVSAKFSRRRGRPLAIIFARIMLGHENLTTLLLTVSHKENL